MHVCGWYLRVHLRASTSMEYLFQKFISQDFVYRYCIWIQTKIYKHHKYLLTSVPCWQDVPIWRSQLPRTTLYNHLVRVRIQDFANKYVNTFIKKYTFYYLSGSILYTLREIITETKFLICLNFVCYIVCGYFMLCSISFKILLSWMECTEDKLFKYNNSNTHRLISYSYYKKHQTK